MPFCQSVGSISLGTGEPQSPMPGVQIQMFAVVGLFVSVMSPLAGVAFRATGGWGGMGLAQVLLTRPKTNWRSWTSMTPFGSGKLTSKNVE